MSLVVPIILLHRFASEQVFKYFGWTNFAVISDTTVTMYTDPAAVEDHLLRTGMQCIYSGTFDGQGVDRMVAHIKQSRPQVIFEYCSEGQAQELICEAYKQVIMNILLMPHWLFIPGNLESLLLAVMCEVQTSLMDSELIINVHK